MVNKWTLTHDGFNRLLSWLDPDREQAGKKYEEIGTLNSSVPAPPF
jgi:hypothetical protein